MANAARKAQIEAVVDALENALYLFEDWGSGFEFDYSRYGVAMTGTFIANADCNTYSDAVVNMYFGWDRPVSDVKITFLGAKSQYANRKFVLREEITKQVLQKLEIICIDQNQSHLFVKR